MKNTTFFVKKFPGLLSLVAVGVLMVCTSVLMFVQNPLHSIIRMVLHMSEGSLFYNMWAAPPYDVVLKIYAFNVTNPKEFLSGREKMNVTEIGPYVYREILTNQNATFNDTDGTVSFNPYREIVFDEERSVGNPTTDKMWTTNLPYVGLQSYLRDSSIFTNLGFAAAARSFGSKPIAQLTMDEYLWGYNDVLIKYANKLLPSWIDFEEFGILARLLHRDNTNRVTIVNDPSKYHSTTDQFLTEDEKKAQYHIAKWNNLPGLKDWGYEKLSPEKVTRCHMVEGAYDGTIFPKDLQKNASLIIFRNAFCRPVPLRFVDDSISEHGLYQYTFKLADDMFDVSPENECFCYQNRCIKGFQSIAPCYYGIPITLSQPHFLNAEPKMLETINGLNPDPELHGSYCNIQPDIGIPLTGSMKIQINLDIGKIRGNGDLKAFNDLQVPLFWIEITTTEMKTYVKVLLIVLCNVVPVVLEIVKYLLGIGGLALISGSSMYTLFKTKIRVPRGLSLNGSDYVPIPIIHIPSEILDKCEKRFSMK